MTLALTSGELLAIVAFLPILLATGLFDLTNMRIPNWLSLAGLGLFLVCLPVLGPEAWLMRAMVGSAAFAICFALFALGFVGGGDAKIFPVTLLFVPVSLVPLYLFAFSFCMIFGMIGLWLVRKRLAHPDAAWVSLQPGAAFPMGISIAATLPVMLALTFIM